MKVLVAEDERVPRTLLSHQLADWGYAVVAVDNGDVAWELLTQPEPPRIAILDWVMPGMDGVAICRKLQETPQLPFIYTILLTARTDESDLIQALSQGAHDFQTKPARPGELRARIAVGQRLVEANDRLQEYAARMEELATIDSLTGVANRRSFFAITERELARSTRQQSPCAVLVLDVDAFKAINDRYGHAAGDRVLKAVAEHCRRTLRTSDLVARLGGDEFAVLLPDTGVETARVAAERLRAAIDTIDYGTAWHGLHATVSIGVTTCVSESCSVDSLLRNADRALYDAKQAGRNRIGAAGICNGGNTPTD